MTSRLALGFSVHTGWAAALVAGGNARHPRIEAREIVELLDDRARFVYHRAAEQSPAKAKRDLEEARREAIARAQEGIARLGHERRLACVAIVARQGALLPLEQIVVAHPRIHLSEGLFYRDVLLAAAERSGLAGQVISPKALDTDDPALAAAGRSLGAPWGKDQKLAALAAWPALAGR